MTKSSMLVLLGLSMFACKGKDANLGEKEVAINQDLVYELERMEEVDQIASYIPQGKYTELSEEEWNAFKDSVYTTH